VVVPAESSRDLAADEPGPLAELDL